MKRSLAVAIAAVSACAGTLVSPAGSVSAAPPGDNEVIAFEVRGVGNGHGRGLSQWGAYGRALAGQSWQDILAAYYGGTQPGTRTQPGLRIRLTGSDGTGSLGVISTSNTARWNGGGAANYSSLYATETSANTFTVWGATSGHSCAPASTLTVPTDNLQRSSPVVYDARVKPLQELLNFFGHNAGPVDGLFGQQTEAAVVRFQQASGLTPADGLWRSDEVAAAQNRLAGGSGVVYQQLATGVAGPIVFTTPASQSDAAAGDVLGVCSSSGAVTHYRGALEFVNTSDGNRVVNVLDVENYLRGVLPKEVLASWGDTPNGMNALRAQSVAARSYGLSQNRYGYASTCDTSSCQVYGGAATRTSASTANWLAAERSNTDIAIRDTAGVVRQWPGGAIVSTEFSASNGPRTAGGLDPLKPNSGFPPIDDPWDDQPGNPHHRWTRVIDADAISSKYGLSSANGVRTAPDAGSPYDGIWANEVVLGNGSTVSAWDFRNAFGLTAPGFELVPITRTVTNSLDFAFIGDSVGVSVASAATSPLQVLTEGMFSSASFDAIGGRRTQGGTIPDGVSAARNVAPGTDLVVVELGYNDTPSTMPSRIDAVMAELRARGVPRVVWTTVSERRDSDFDVTNAAIRAATARWSELVVIDWHAASDDTVANRWFSDGVHLTATGQAEFSLWLRSEILRFALDGYTPPSALLPGQVLRVPVTGAFGVPASGVAGVALNVTAVGPVGPGWLRVWPCGSPEPETSSVNFMSKGAVEPNAAMVPVDATGQVCVVTSAATDVIVDVSGWFDSGVRQATGRLVDTRQSSRVAKGQVLRVPVTGAFGVPASGVAGVALNVTAVGPAGPGWLRVWPCGSPEPETSSVNFMSAGAVEPNAVVVSVDATGQVCVLASETTDVIVDVSGWFDSGVRQASGRVVDTRQSSRVAKGQVLRVPVTGAFGVPASGVAGVALNVTAVNPAGPGWLRVWPCGSPEPETSSVNFMRAGAVEPNAVVVSVDATGQVCVLASETTDVIVDVSGWFDSGVRQASGRIVDTRYGVGPTPS